LVRKLQKSLSLSALTAGTRFLEMGEFGAWGGKTRLRKEKMGVLSHGTGFPKSSRVTKFMTQRYGWKRITRPAGFAGGAEIDGLICLGSDDIDAEVIRAARRLKIISSFSTGVNNITSTPPPPENPGGSSSPRNRDHGGSGVCSHPGRRAQDCGRRLCSPGRWKNSSHLDLPGWMNHARLGIIGLGRIGAQVAKRGKAFNMQVYITAAAGSSTWKTFWGWNISPTSTCSLGRLILS
jgi:hypothetical protein